MSIIYLLGLRLEPTVVGLNGELVPRVKGIQESHSAHGVNKIDDYHLCYGLCGSVPFLPTYQVGPYTRRTRCPYPD